MVGAAIAVQAAKIMADNPGISEGNAYTIAATDLSNYGLGGKPATPLPPVAPTYIPAQVQQQFGPPPLNDATALKSWLGNALDGYPADEAQKWAQDLIRTLPMAQQQTMGDLIMQSVRDNAIAGAAREKEVRAELQIKYPNASIQDQQYLRDSKGNIVRDTITQTARRLDHVVVVNGRVIDVVETTSMNANKGSQIAKEERILDKGGNYILDRVSGDYIQVPSSSRIVRKP
jgi:hypothetical protein